MESAAETRRSSFGHDVALPETPGAAIGFRFATRKCPALAHHERVPLAIELKPVETLLFRSDVVALGTFRCPASHAMFRDSGPCTHHTIVFPRTSTVIHHDGAASFTASPNCATLCNQHQEYTRTAVSSSDDCDWLVIADDVLVEATGGDERRPFRATHVPVDSATYLRQRRLFDRVTTLDPLAVDEEVIAIGERIAGTQRPPGISTAMRDRVESLKQTICAAPARRFSLRVLAAAADCSPFHLCRAFRAVTGNSITSYQHALRLRLALPLLRDTSCDLSDIALRLGFASHSHFTALFRRHFGVTPSRYRDGI
jgi:AraC-like DNA-binding protein